MNYLAHLALSGPLPDMQVGGFLGDWLKGPLEKHAALWPATVIKGVERHRYIDTWVDRQAETCAAIALLGSNYRRIAGPVIDIAFDHYLAKQFSRYHSPHLTRFCEDAFCHLNAHKANMPQGAQVFLQRAQTHLLFEGYAQPDVYLNVVGSLRHRISKPELLADIEIRLMSEYDALEHIFHQFYPRLQSHIALHATTTAP